MIHFNHNVTLFILLQKEDEEKGREEGGEGGQKKRDNWIDERNDRFSIEISCKEKVFIFFV